MGIRQIVRLFERGSVCVVGMRGRGKDLLMSNVVVRRKLPYVSNMDYTKGDGWEPFNYSIIDIGNDHNALLRGEIKPYRYPFADGTDIYLSDAGVYFPSQYNERLNKTYPAIPVFMALSRHLGEASLHFNAQNLNRVWDKIREQSDTYINCDWVIKPLLKLGIVVQQVTIYDKPQSCIDKVEPFRIPPPLLPFGERAMLYDIEKARYRQNYGSVERRILIYVNKTKYDARRFKTILQGE